MPIEPCPLAIVDVHYGTAGARAACVVAARWTDALALEEQVARVGEVRPYRPGAFFERELPCLLEVLGHLRDAASLRAIVVDGHVELDDQGTPGLGAHLHDRLGGRVAVVGVAKSTYRGSPGAARVLRGSSRRPLIVTARGLPLALAARLVQEMHGAHRLPTLIARADRLARGATAGVGRPNQIP